jgi:hypothetical protein
MSWGKKTLLLFSERNVIFNDQFLNLFHGRVEQEG